MEPSYVETPFPAIISAEIHTVHLKIQKKILFLLHIYTLNNNYKNTNIVKVNFDITFLFTFKDIRTKYTLNFIMSKIGVEMKNYTLAWYKTLSECT